jgi:hypothetical protein
MLEFAPSRAVDPQKTEANITWIGRKAGRRSELRDVNPIMEAERVFWRMVIVTG